METISPYNLNELCNENSWNLCSKDAFVYVILVCNCIKVQTKLGGKQWGSAKGCLWLWRHLQDFWGLKVINKNGAKLNNEIWHLQDSESNILSVFEIKLLLSPITFEEMFCLLCNFTKKIMNLKRRIWFCCGWERVFSNNSKDREELKKLEMSTSVN